MSTVTILYSPSFALIALIATVIIGLFLAVAVFSNAPKSATHQIFSLLTIFTIAWLLVNYVTSSFVQFPFFLPHALFLHRVAIFIATPLSFLFFLLGYVLPSSKLKLSRKIFYLSCFVTVVVMVLNLSPYAFTSNVVSGYLSMPVAGPGLIPFSILSTIFSFLAVYFLFKTYRHSQGIARAQAKSVLLGLLIMLALIILTVLIPIVLFGSLFFLQFTPLYALIFLGSTAYAITKYQLFNIKILITQALVLVMCIILFAKTFSEPTPEAQIIDLIIFLFMVIFGSLLVRSVHREVEQREKIEIQEKELEVANKGQEDLIHIINHQIKGYLTKGRIIFSELLEEPDYGPVNYKAKPMMEEGLKSLTDGVEFVQGVLNASNIEHGTFTYTMQSVDLKSLVMEVADKQRESAIKKGLTYDVVIADGDYVTMADPIQLKEAFRNLIDNSIHYTQKGGIHVSLSRQIAAQHQSGSQNVTMHGNKNGDKFLFAVIDTGIGLSPEDKPRLFTKGGRGKDSLKINVNSTGYGLSFVKGVIEGHNGHVWAESQGPGKGSQFYTELPVRVS